MKSQVPIHPEKSAPRNVLVWHGFAGVDGKLGWPGRREKTQSGVAVDRNFNGRYQLGEIVISTQPYDRWGADDL